LSAILHTSTVYDYHTICGECAAIGPLFGEAAEQADASWNEEWGRGATVLGSRLYTQPVAPRRTVDELAATVLRGPNELERD
jgi:hypothetical protein